MSATDLEYRAAYLVLKKRMVLSAYAMSGIAIAYGAASLCCCTDRACRATYLHAKYTMSGTDRAYRATYLHAE
eukprot:3289502-Rhodomonas_salina.2